jgi:hypothetical protein
MQESIRANDEGQTSVTLDPLCTADVAVMIVVVGRSPFYSECSEAVIAFQLGSAAPERVHIQ